MRPDFGAGLELMLHEPDTPATRRAHRVNRSVQRAPRGELQGMNFVRPDSVALSGPQRWTSTVTSGRNWSMVAALHVVPF